MDDGFGQTSHAGCDVVTIEVAKSFRIKEHGRAESLGTLTMQSRSKLNDIGDTLPSPGLLAGAPASSTPALEPSDSEHSASKRRDSNDSARLDSAPLPSSVPPRVSLRQASTECLSDDVIVEYRQGSLSQAELHQIDIHLDGCASCRELVEVVIADEPDELTSASQVTTFHRGFVAAGRYEIVSFLGKGGMGEVYAALDQLTGKKVALKTVVCTATDDARAVRKLFDEVLNAQRVAHPHVFKIYDLHEHRDALRGRVPFFTMEFIEGESLGARLRRSGPLPVAEAEVIARQLLEGLAAAHARGVLHLDFKSDNVMLRRTSAGFDAVVMDFGLSRAPDAESRQRTSERLQMAGTLPYMSIEQLECQGQLGPASDVYSFGVVLYEMLAGQLPFRGESYSAILLKQLRERPAAPSDRVPGLSRAVDQFVLECLSSHARDRFDDAQQALRAIDALPPWQQPARASRPGRSARVVAFVALVSGAAAALHGEVTRRSAPASLASPAARELRPAVETPAPPAAPAPAAAASPAEERPARDARPSEVGVGGHGSLPAAVSPAAVSPAALPPVLPLAVPPGLPTRPAGSDAARQSEPPKPVDDAEPSAPSPALAPPLAPPRAAPAPSDWTGPPPQRVPRPRPL
jgi:hypothetical protein